MDQMNVRFSDMGLSFDPEALTGAEIWALTESHIANTYGRLPVALVRGEGTRVWDADGRSYLDFISGLAVTALGHANPGVQAAVARQERLLAHTSNLYFTAPAALLAAHLVALSSLDKVFFCNSGAEANEAAIKFARLYAKGRAKDGEPARFEIITADRSFHGRTLGALAATGQTKYQAGFEPMPQGFVHVPLNDIAALSAAVNERTCAIMLEPVQGEAGVYPCDPGYLSAVRELCDRTGILLILDEVQTGLWRTGRPFACQHYGVKPDIMASAKALGAGLPLGATLATDKVASVLKPGHHASTFGGNPVSCAAGLAFLKVMLEDGLGDEVPATASYLRAGLERLAASHPRVVDVRGLGLIMGVEYDGDGAAITLRAREKGLLINCIGGRVFRFLPPLNVSHAEIDEALDILASAIDEQEAVE